MTRRWQKKPSPVRPPSEAYAGYMALDSSDPDEPRPADQPSTEASGLDMSALVGEPGFSYFEPEDQAAKLRDEWNDLLGRVARLEQQMRDLTHGNPARHHPLRGS